jgi:aminoglycoside phosphotransferase (APT) family kinase protein
VCHGDLHPFNVLVDGDRATLIDWTTATVTDPAFDVAFTSMVLRHAPIDVPDRLRPTMARATAWLAQRFVAEYRTLASAHGIHIDDEQLRWHTALQCTRALADVAERNLSTEGGVDPKHPFVTMRAAVTADLDAIIGDD